MMKFRYVVAALFACALPAVAHAGPTATFNGVCTATGSATQAKCTSGVGGAAAPITITATDDSTLKVMITAWQANQATMGADAGKITAANLGAYDKGFGVTGLGDQSGGNNYHQIDNAGGYTDFVMLQFSRSVQLSSATLNVFGIANPYGSGTSTDSDLSFFDLGSYIGNPAVWNSAIDLNGATNDTSLWKQPALDGTGTRVAALAPTTFSQVWLISAAQLPLNDRDDGFKLGQFVVKSATPPVPEPATWAMLMVGFGAIGATLRRRQAAQTALA